MHKNGHCKTACKSRCLKFFVCGVVFVLLGSLAVELLWNWLTPALFGWRTIDFLQALGILVLSRLLFGKMFCGGCHSGRWHRHQDLSQMTPEEREKIQAALKDGCRDDVA